MTETVRFKAADADDRIDRIVRRVLRRKVIAVPVAPSTVPGPDRVVPALTAGQAAVPLGVLAPTPVATDGAASAQRDGHPSVELEDGATR
jgi:hypothetical protein